jgi:dihydroflavonol-4-reductase
MRVMVTGGTGFVGSHTVRRFLAQGHSVRLLVRDADKVRRVFDPLDIGFPKQDIIVGDIVDETAVNEAMAGCDAVYHGAALVSMRRAMARQVLETNARGVALVVGGGHRRGLPSIVYVSSMSIFFSPGSGPLALDQPIAPGTTAYAQSKAAAEHEVRRLQSEGAPIRVSYPTGIIGPDDPGLSNANQALYTFFKQTGVNTSNGFQIVDVRDLAALHGQLLELPGGAHRYAAAGPYLNWPETYRLLDEITGTRLWRFPCPGGLMRFGGRIGDFIKQFWDFSFPLTRDAMEYATLWPGTVEDSSAADLGIAFRSARDTYTDSVRWLYRAGHLERHHVGRLAEDAGASSEPAGASGESAGASSATAGAPSKKDETLSGAAS